MSAPDRRARLDRGHERLSVRRQCALLGLARSGVYRPPAPTREDDAAAMRRIDGLYTDCPFFGSRRIAFELKMSRKRVQRLMRLMGIAALGPKPRTSKPAPGHKVFPYLLRGVSIERPNQVWAADITYVPVGAGFLYLVAIMDWASRAVLAWRLSTTRSRRPWRALASRRSSTPTRAASSRARPSPASASRWTGAAASSTISSSSGCGALRHEDIYLKHYADGREARAGIASWIAFYNSRRPHQALGYKTPMSVWRLGTTLPLDEKDMTLRLDNAGALPTCPQPQQHQAPAA